MRNLLISTLLIALSACAAKLTDLELGKVVVYRNGVAYFERFAVVEDGEVSLLIPEEKVNDLLKSLKVEDAKTGELIPVGFPKRAGDGGLVTMRVSVPGDTNRRVKLSYVSESPAWKPSYRLSLVEDGTIEFQGWAIVDNVSGEDWNQVAIGVGSTSALSFRYDLWTVRDVHRQTLSQSERLAKAPPTATGLAPNGVAKVDQTSTSQGITLNEDYTKNIPIPGRTFEGALGPAAGSSGDTLGTSFAGSTSLENTYIVEGVNVNGISVSPKRSAKEIAAERRRKEFHLRQRQTARAEADKQKRRNVGLAKQLLGAEGAYVIVGVASPSVAAGDTLAFAMANELRNEMINRGISPAKLTVSTRVGAVGEPTTLEINPANPERGSNTETNQTPSGESKFGSKVPVSIPHGGSSMVSIVSQQTSGEVVYLYDPVSKHGNTEFAFKAIRFENPTGQHLEGGPVTVFGEGTFVGEGLTEAIAPGASALLPYALDHQIHITQKTDFSDSVVGLVRVIDDGAIVSTERRSHSQFTIHNRTQNETTVYVRHDSDRGWKLKSGPAKIQNFGGVSVFPVVVKAGARKTVKLVEYTPITATIDLTTDKGVRLLSAYFRKQKENSPLSRRAAALEASHRSIAKKLRQIDLVAGKLALYRGRLDELHNQLVTLEIVKSRGKLLRNIKTRMTEMSNRVQQNIAGVIELREQIMVERFAYREMLASLSELTDTGELSVASIQPNKS